ncbi:MAG: hypothetical protein AB7C97_04835 [Oscillospiraceae bacterium]
MSAPSPCPRGAIYAYAYNAEGLRTSKTTTDNTINYLYENGYILIETDGDGIVTAKNTWGIGNRLAQLGRNLRLPL